MADYTFKFPTGVTSFTDRLGNKYYPDANGLVTITDPTLVQNFLNAGMEPAIGFIEGTAIGSVTPAAGTFTSLSSSGQLAHTGTTAGLYGTTPHSQRSGANQVRLGFTVSTGYDSDQFTSVVSLLNEIQAALGATSGVGLFKGSA